MVWIQFKKKNFRWTPPRVLGLGTAVPPPRRRRIGAAGIQSRCGEVGLQSPDPVQPSSTWAVREAKPSPEDKAQARMPRAVSRSPPPFRRRRSPSPRYTSRRNRRDRSRSPFSSRYLPPYPSLGFLLSELRLKEGRYCLLFSSSQSTCLKEGSYTI